MLLQQYTRCIQVMSIYQFDMQNTTKKLVQVNVIK